MDVFQAAESVIGCELLHEQEACRMASLRFTLFISPKCLHNACEHRG